MSKTLKFGIILLVVLCLLLMVITFIDFPFNKRAQGSTAPTEEIPPVVADNPDLVLAVERTIEKGSSRQDNLDYAIDHIQVQDDGQMAIVWLAALDPETGELLGREPELALAQRDAKGNWQVLLKEAADFDETFKQFQYAQKSILDGDTLSGEVEAMPKGTTVYGGYYLPWAQNLEKRLTWSVGHTSCYPTYYCTHAFDFADGTMFPMVAAKGGTVYHWKDTCNNGDTSCTNSITIEDRSTTPWTYQIYIHIAKGSVPDNLKNVGTPVLQGQYIADVDDTGYSSGHHVHFMVVSETTKYLSTSGYVWGVAEDITFKDVSINWDANTKGGRPRLPWEADSYGGEGQTFYVSGNKPAHPPTAGLTSPANKTVVTTPSLSVSGWGEDDIAVTKMEILANYNGNWIQIGNEQTANPFTANVDLCSTTIPDGPFKLGIRAWDYEGNPSAIVGIRQLIKNVECGASGTDPSVKINLSGDKLVMPLTGIVSATATPGSQGSAIASVEFWFHNGDWKTGNWVYLGKDTNGSNGWQALISTTDLEEGSDYTLMAVATDSAGRQGAEVRFDAIVDKTPPWVIINPVVSPYGEPVVSITWSGGDDLTGLDYYSLRVDVDGVGFKVLANNLTRTTTSYPFAVSDGQMLIFELTAYDLAGNKIVQKRAMYTTGYEFPNGSTFSIFFNP